MKTRFVRIAEEANHDEDNIVVDWNVPLGTPTFGYRMTRRAGSTAKPITSGSALYTHGTI